MSKAAEFIILLTQMTADQQLSWERNAGKTGYLASLGDIIAEVSLLKDPRSIPLVYLLQVRDASGVELTRIKQRVVSTSAAPATSVQKLYDTIVSSASDVAWSQILEATTKYRASRTES